MLLQFFTALREARVPVSLREYLVLLGALERDLAEKRVEEFYFLARTALVKDEGHLDRFDRVFGSVFKGLETVGEAVAPTAIPEEWLRKLAEKYLTDAEKAEMKALGWDKLFETLKQRLAEQKERHQGGSKWIGTGGTSPFGAYGYNPEGIRIGQDGNRNFRAVKVWDKREFKDLDDTVELGTRTMRLALRRLRRFARTGAADELDLDGTIRESARQGYIDVRLRPERRNAVKVLLFLDVGGSMDWHVEQVEELFSAARSEFKHFAHFYFHNCPYEAVWTENRRRHDAATPLVDVIRTYPSDYRVVFVGDASMSPYEIAAPGGSVEHWNEEPGAAWVQRVLAHFPKAVWLNPVPAPQWGYTQSIAMMRRLFSDRMFPLTLEGLDGAMRALLR
ncbi:VWA domain-containing protein [Methylobacterium sp. E-041]|uniref:vWA domain-containing protein n=1 Tax=unclassified Methylobacterium TaxID=2615210 RepID=UPI0011C9FABB|nr:MULTISPECIES: VWA domain-containing protein [unclassified Methylobacterium]MCJ2006980.1 VWA domain-containing protein [Methylobacterium sp. J-092]MCJ2040506.1 VWA domain-containing protein [Methylobacterium sp. J-059]MCJ2106667.1 VWA domain-containing protein [Methylobacterium sp. E-041]TXN64927.1 VWA domain-containing protein [Methylobacterium sp. WL6]